MQHPQAQQYNKSASWNKVRLDALQTKQITRPWEEKQRLGMMADAGSVQAANVINKLKWFDTLRQDDAKYTFFMQAAREGTPFRDRHRLHRI